MKQHSIDFFKMSFQGAVNFCTTVDANCKLGCKEPVQVHKEQATAQSIVSLFTASKGLAGGEKAMHRPSRSNLQ